MESLKSINGSSKTLVKNHPECRLAYPAARRNAINGKQRHHIEWSPADLENSDDFCDAGCSECGSI